MSVKKSFWKTIPGILTAVAAVITAIVGLLTVIYKTGNNDTPPTTIEIETNVATITLNPKNLSIPIGEKVQLSVTVKNSNGQTLYDKPMSWISNDYNIASITPSGKVTAKKLGTAIITATVEDVSASCEVKVERKSVASVTITPNDISLETGSTSQIFINTKDESGNLLSDREINLEIKNSDIASISNSNVITGLTAGTTEIIATSEEISDVAIIKVTEIPVATIRIIQEAISVLEGNTEQVNVELRDKYGKIVHNRTVIYSIAQPELANVDNNGLVKGLRWGITELKVKIDNIEANVKVYIGKNGLFPID